MNTNNIFINNKRNWIYFTIGLVLLILSLILSYSGNIKSLQIRAQQSYQKEFLHREAELNHYLHKIVQDTAMLNMSNLYNYCEKNNLLDKYRIVLYNNSLLASWTSEMQEFPFEYEDYSFQQVINNYGEWFYITEVQYGNRKCLGILLLNDLPLHSAFNKLFSFDINSSVGKTLNIYNRHYKQAFKLHISSAKWESKTESLLLLILWLGAFTFLILAFVGIFMPKTPGTKRNIFVGIIIAIIGGGLYLLRFINYPSTALFSSMYYSSIYHSLGELLLNTYASLLLAVFFKLYFHIDTSDGHKVKYGKLWATLILCLIFMADALLYCIAIGAMRDSIVIFNPTIMTSYDILSLVAMISMLFALWTLLFITDKAISLVKSIVNNDKSSVKILIYTFTAFLITALIYAIKNQPLFGYIASFILAIIIYALLTLKNYKPEKGNKYLYIWAPCACIALMIYYVGKDHINYRQQAYKDSLAEILISDNDPYTSYSLSELADKIAVDSTLQEFFTEQKTQSSELKHNIICKYLDKYSQKYHINITLYNASDPFEMRSMHRDLLSYTSIDRISVSENVLYRNLGFGQSEYMLRIPVMRNYRLMGYMVILFRHHVQGPLITDETIQRNGANCSYAEYENGNLKYSIINHKKLKYEPVLSSYKLDTLYTGVKFTKNGYSHYVYTHNNKVFLVSDKMGIWEKISFLVILILLQFIFNIIPKTIESGFLHKFTVNDSVQRFINRLVLGVTFSVLVIGLICMIAFFNSLNKNNNLRYNTNTLSRFHQIVNNTLLSHDVKNTIADSTLKWIMYDLKQINISDLKIYNEKGYMVLNYGKGILFSTKIDPQVYLKLQEDKSGTIAMDKTIQQTKYIDLYQTLCDEQGNIIGYIAMPYPSVPLLNVVDAKQGQMVIKFLIICISMVILIIIISIILIHTILAPILSVSHSMAEINLGEDIHTLPEKRNDEVGELVKNYNQLLTRLKNSAELLESTSQNTAWREMAKQVAHDVKNPLTPMMLKTQYLQMKWNKHNITDEEMNTYFNMMLTQMDSLTQVASSFSQFASVNQDNMEVADLYDMVKGVLDTYNNGENNNVYILNHFEITPCMIFTDKANMIRVFNNLIQNAIQAKRQDILIIKIDVCSYGDKMWQITVSDNGTGIPEEIQEKIFQPNFTTKTSGTGLGLAIVKNIITTQGGKISFKSVKDEGTTFTIVYPKYIAK